MGKKHQYSISLDEEFMDELDKTIEKFSLANRSALIQKWSRIGFEKLKENLPKKREIAVEI